jgi:hypothetical protein
MNYESIGDIYFKFVAKIGFYLMLGITSTVGQFVTVKFFLTDDWIAAAISSIWAVIMIMVYAFYDAYKHHEHKNLQTNFENLKMVKTPLPTSNSKFNPPL